MYTPVLSNMNRSCLQQCSHTSSCPRPSPSTLNPSKHPETSTSDPTSTLQNSKISATYIPFMQAHITGPARGA
ncbi:hypothetical protein BDZ45DRAFT_406831 [Acephala macrosclerotiorum]|nr:hypothetical protein BDZ45DRAFT_406831 [Acephala macrosclerotiorum]